MLMDCMSEEFGPDPARMADVCSVMSAQTTGWPLGLQFSRGLFFSCNIYLCVCVYSAHMYVCMCTFRMPSALRVR